MTRGRRPYLYWMNGPGIAGRPGKAVPRRWKMLRTLLIASAITLVGVAGGLSAAEAHDHKRHRHYHHYYDGGPPPWAPAYGRRGKTVIHHHYYYPPRVVEEHVHVHHYRPAYRPYVARHCGGTSQVIGTLLGGATGGFVGHHFGRGHGNT
ncbi:MAG: hypothetical protein ACREH3_03285, partial [Geminicoccales bacterium]